MLIHAFIPSQLEYCNALFTGLPAKSVAWLKFIQNSLVWLRTRWTLSTHHSMATLLNILQNYFSPILPFTILDLNLRVHCLSQNLNWPQWGPGISGHRCQAVEFSPRTFMKLLLSPYSKLNSSLFSICYPSFPDHWPSFCPFLSR